MHRGGGGADGVATVGGGRGVNLYQSLRTALRTISISLQNRFCASVNPILED